MAEAKPTLVGSVVLPGILVALVLGALYYFASLFLQDTRTLLITLALACAAFVGGRVLHLLDRPAGRGRFLRHVLTSTSFGLVAFGGITAVLRDGPGWPWTPWLSLVGAIANGVVRGHATLRDRSADPAGDAPWMRIFRARDRLALLALGTGYPLRGVTAYLVFAAYAPYNPFAQRMLPLAAAGYFLAGGVHLVRFASDHDRPWLAWIKAHGRVASAVFLVLAGYAAFRRDLEGTIPLFPLVEFGIAIVVFTLVLVAFGLTLRRLGALLPTASQARDHERVVSEIREPDYDAVARPVTRFIESGSGQREYASVVAAAAPAHAALVEARVGEHREPPRPPALDLAWGFAAGAAMTLGLATAALVLGIRLFDAPMPYPLYLGLLFVGFGVYAQQDAARAHHRPWLATAVAAGGTAILLLDFLLFAGTVGTLAEVPGIAWGVVAAVAAAMVGIPALAGWRQQRRLDSGAHVDARRLAPALELANELQKARGRAATLMFVVVALLLPVPWLADQLAARTGIPDDFPAFLDDVLAVVIWVLAGFGGAALVRFYGLTRGRPRLLAREKAKRERRLALHKEIMGALERGESPVQSLSIQTPRS